jgi:hypothetical protein
MKIYIIIYRILDKIIGVYIQMSMIINHSFDSHFVSLLDKLQKKYEAGLAFPDTFFFTGALIILTNKPLSIIDNATEGAVSNRGWHQEMLFSVDGAVDLIKNFETRITSYNGIDIAPENTKKAVDFLTSPHAVTYYKTEGKVPTLRTLGRIALDYEMGNEVDEDRLITQTEKPAY